MLGLFMPYTAEGHLYTYCWFSFYQYAFAGVLGLPASPSTADGFQSL